MADGDGWASSIGGTARGIPTGVWDDGGWFKIFDHGSDGFDDNLVEGFGGACDWTGTERFNDACL